MTSLKEIRKIKGYTQQQLANLLGIKQQQYARYEREINKISLEMFLKIIDVCECEIKIIKK